MNRYSPDAHPWLGLCRKAPAVSILLPGIPGESRSESGAGGSGTIGRGIEETLSGVKTLIRNPQLLWFPFFLGLVLAMLFIAQYTIRLLSVYPYDALDFPSWIVLTFATELATVFFLTVLLAGLVLIVSQNGSSLLSFRGGLALAKEHLKTLAGWSLVIAPAGTLIFLLSVGLLPVEVTFRPLFSQFPFNFILLPEIYHTGPVGGTFAIEYGLAYTLVLSAVNLLLFALTLFVVPLLVLEKKSLKEAFSGSAALMKNVWREGAVCVLVPGTVVCAALCTSSIFQTVYGIVAPEMLLFWYPGDGWIAAGLIYLAALCSLACIVATAGGIASLDLYRYARTREPAL
jgi:hypothetical protein